MSGEAPRNDVVHLIERTSSPTQVYGEIREQAPPYCTILDLSAGSISGLSRLDDEQIGGRDPGHRWLSAADFVADLGPRSQTQYIEWLSEVGNRPLLAGRSVKEWFTYDGEVSLWWFTRAAEKHSLGHPYRWLFFCFGVIDHLLRSGAVDAEAEWHLWVPDEPTGRALRAAIGDRGTVVIHADPAAVRPRRRTFVSHALLGPVWQVAQALRSARGQRRARRASDAFSGPSEGRRRILVSTLFPKSWRELPESERFREDVAITDMYFGALPWRLQEQGLSVGWWRSSTTSAPVRRWERALAKQTLPDASPWATLGWRAAWALLRHQLRWVRSYRRLFVEQRVQDAWRFGEIPLGHWLVEDCQRLCQGAAFAAMLKLEQTRALHAALRPDAVLYRDEMYESGRIISAALKGRTSLIGIQHGLINEEATVYRFDPRDIGAGAGEHDHIRHCPVPDAFAVFGEYTRELFARWGGYDAARVVPVGGARHDALVQHFLPGKIARDALRREIRVRLGLPLDRPVVLLCTHMARDAGRWFDLIVSGLDRARQSAFVAVKTHQFRGGEEFVRAVAEERGFSDYRAFTDATYPLISCADVVVGGSSTIILESYLLDTPVITICGTEGYEAYPFRAESLGEAAGTTEEMADALARLLRGGTDRDDAFQHKRSAVLRRHLWNQDAGAADRLGDLVRDRLAIDTRADTPAELAGVADRS
jgi:hypothetical protein